MKTRSIVDLSCAMQNVLKEKLTEKIGFLEAKGIKLTKREKQAIEAGMRDGWHAAINYIQLHNLK